MSLWGPETTGLNEWNEEGGNVYPNPAESQLWVALPKGLEKATVFVYNQAGVLVKQFAVGQKLQSISLNDVNSGVYHFQVVGENRSWNKKIVIR
jgi:hypothetical protein